MFVNSLRAGGAERMVSELSKKLALSADVDILTVCNDSCIWKDSLDAEGIKVMSLGKRFLNPIYIYRLFRILKIGKYDVVHTHLTYPQLYGAIASYFFHNIKWFTTEHSSNNNRRGCKLFKVYDKWLYSRYSKVFSVAKSTQDSLLKWLEDKGTKKFSVFPNGVDVPLFSNAIAINRESLGYSRDDIILMMVGRLADAKDPVTIMKALDMLPSMYKLILVGDGPLANEYKSEAIKLKCADRINFVGKQFNVPEWLKMADIHIQSSHWEGLPTTVMEAMASGTVSIGSRVPGNIDLLEDYMMFEHENPEDLVRLICSIDKSWIEKQSEYVKKFDMSYLAKELLKKYKDK